MADESILGGASEPVADAPEPIVPAEGINISLPLDGAPSSFDFREAIPAEYRDQACLQDIPDYGTMVKNYVNAQAKIGTNLNVPGADASPEQKQEFYQKLGVPETADGYKESFTAGGFEFEGEGTKRLVEKARTNGITPAALIELVKEYNEITGGAGDLSGEEIAPAFNSDDTINSLRQEWGADYDRSLGLAQQVVKSYPGLADGLASSGAGNDPAVIKAFAAIGASMANSGLIDGAAVGAISREDALSKADALMATPAYQNSSDPAYKTTFAEVQRLFEQAYPNK